MSKYVKLTEAGAKITKRITAVTVDTSGSYADYHLQAESGEIIVVPKAAADRQLERIKCKDATDLVGAWVEVSRSDKPGKNGKLFWNIDIATAPQGAEAKRMESPYQHPGAAQTDVPPPQDPDEAPPPSDPSPSNDQAERLRQRNAKRQEVAKSYLALWTVVADHLNKTCDQHEIAVTSDAIQAATATIWIGWRDAGVR